LERLNTSAGNPVKEILLKLNLPDHRSIFMDSKIDNEVPDSSCLTDSLPYAHTRSTNVKTSCKLKYMFQDFRYSDTVRLS
ncbi:hypothetical protein Tco_1239098, partial [Tanacetum coccineum]